MSSWSKKKQEREERAAETDAFLDDLANKVEEQAPKVRALTSWLEKRNRENGFGRDFEWTLIPRGRGWT